MFRFRPLLTLSLATAVSLGFGASGASAQLGARQFYTNIAGSYLAGLIAQADGDVETAATYFSRVLQQDPDNPRLNEITLLLWLEDGDVSRALPWAQRMIENDPGHEPARLALAAEAFRFEDYDGALTQVEPIEGDAVSDLSAALLTAWAQVGLGDTDAALATIDSVRLNEDWYAPYIAYHTALILDLAGRSEEAVDLMQTALRGDTSLGPLTAFARIIARADDATGAEALLQSYLDVVPSEPMVEDLMAEIEAGGDIAPVVANASEGAAEVFFSIGSAFAGDGLGGLSLPYMQLSRYVGPATDLPTLAVGQLLQEGGQDEQAVDVLNDIPDDSPVKLTAEIRAALSLEVLERSDEAAERLEPYAAANPDSIPAAVTLSTIYRNDDDFDAVVATLDRTIDTFDTPRSEQWRLYYLRGIAYEQTDRWSEAEADFQQALGLSPDQPDVLNYLGYSWVDQGINLEEGLDLLARAVEQRPRSGFIVDSLGWAHYQLGDYEEAVALLEQAVTLQPDHPVLFDHLGDAYWRDGRRREARYQWSHALDYDPDPELRATIEEKLESGLPDDVLPDK